MWFVISTVLLVTLAVWCASMFVFYRLLTPRQASRIVPLLAFGFAVLLTGQADAQIFGRRQPQVVNQFNFGGGQQQFRQQRVVQQRVIQQRVIVPHHVQQQVIVPRRQVVVRQQFVQPVYAQPVVIQQQVHGCNGGLQLNSGCSTFFSY